MPYLSDEELRSELVRAGSASALATTSDEPADFFGTSVVSAAGTMGSAALIGLIRSKLEDPATGEWNIPGTRWDAEAVVCLGLAGVAAMGQHLGLERARGFCALGAIGVGSHYLGEVARRFGKTGELSWNTGAPEAAWQSTSPPPLNDVAPVRQAA